MLSGEPHSITWEFHEHITNVSYNGAVYDFGQEKMVTLRHPFPQSTDYAEIRGGKMMGHENASDVGDFWEGFVGEEQESDVFTTSHDPLSYFIDPIDNSLTYSFARDVSPNKYYDVSYNFKVFKCFWPDCTPPTTPPPTTPPMIKTFCDWSDPSCWSNGTV